MMFTMFMLSRDTMVNISLEDPSWWLWVTYDMVPRNLVEKCGLDNEGFIFVTKEDIMDVIYLFIVNCILSDSHGKVWIYYQNSLCISSQYIVIFKLKGSTHDLEYHILNIFSALFNFNLCVSSQKMTPEHLQKCKFQSCFCFHLFVTVSSNLVIFMQSNTI